MTTSISPFALLPTLILACVLPSSAQHFQQIQGATLSKISAGGASVWGVDPSGNVFRYNASTQSFDQISGASLFQISAGGGNIVQPDEVWGINTRGRVFRFNARSQTFDQVPGVAMQIAVGPGRSQCNPYEIWGLTPAGKPLRYNFCKQAYDSYKTPIPFSYISVGEIEVWGGNIAYGQAYKFDPASNQFRSTGPIGTAVVNVDAVFGIENNEAYFYFSSNWIDLNFAATTLAAGGNGVWALNSSNQVFRFHPTFNPTFEQVPGSLTQLSVGGGTSVWGINTAGQVFVFETP